MPGAYVTGFGPHYGTNPGKPIVLAQLSTAPTEIYRLFTHPKTLTKRQKGRIKG